MSYTCLLEEGVEFSAASFADIPVSVRLKSIRSGGPCCCSDNAKESSRASLSGMMLEHSTDDRGPQELILSQRDSLATMSPRLEKKRESMERSLPSSLRFAESCLRFDLATSSWKTVGTLWEEDLPESSVKLPGWGMILSGVVWEPLTSGPTTKGFGRGLFPTPMTGTHKWNGTFQEGGGSLSKWRETWLGRQWINPGFWEGIMGWPIGWTDLQPLVPGSFRRWLLLHGVSSPNKSTPYPP